MNAVRNVHVQLDELIEPSELRRKSSVEGAAALEALDGTDVASLVGSAQITPFFADLKLPALLGLIETESSSRQFQTQRWVLPQRQGLEPIRRRTHRR